LFTIDGTATGETNPPFGSNPAAPPPARPVLTAEPRVNLECYLLRANAWQHDVVTTNRNRLLAGTTDAVHRGDTASAWRLLQTTGVTDRPHPGPTDADLLAVELELEQQRELIRLRRLKSKVEFEDISADIIPE
jgi:hypothetical protein